MQSADQEAPKSRGKQWAGIIMSALAVVFLLFDSIGKLMVIGPVVDSFGQLGYPVSLARAIGLIQLACIVLYVIPRTSIVGAILLTGYLGGAIASHVRIESPLFTHTLFPIYVAVLIWGGLYVRDRRLRTLIAPLP